MNKKIKFFALNLFVLLVVSSSCGNNLLDITSSNINGFDSIYRKELENEINYLNENNDYKINSKDIHSLNGIEEKNFNQILKTINNSSNLNLKLDKFIYSIVNVFFDKNNIQIKLLVSHKKNLNLQKVTNIININKINKYITKNQENDFELLKTELDNEVNHLNKNNTYQTNYDGQQISVEDIYNLEQIVRYTNNFNLNNQLFNYEIVDKTMNENTINFKLIVYHKKNIFLRKTTTILTVNGFFKNTLVRYIDPKKEPNKFIDYHLFDLNTMQSTSSVHNLITKTPLFQNSLNNLYYQLNNFINTRNNTKGINFDIDNTENMHIDFYRLIKDIGIYGDYKTNDYDYYKYFPSYFFNGFITKQKYLKSSNAINKFNLKIIESNSLKSKINEIIENNIFGFLPSNLSQFLYYLKLEDIRNIFRLNKDLKDVYADFDDEKGYIDIYLLDIDKKVYKIKIDVKNFANLRKNLDYKKYIYDRTFQIRYGIWVYEKEDLINNNYVFKQNHSIGTVWVLDRILNLDLQKQNKYEFLVATNVHVLDWSRSFEKDNEILSSTYKDNWNAGFVSKVWNNSTNQWVSNDRISKHTDLINMNTYEKLNRTKDRVPVQFSKYNWSDDINKLETEIKNKKIISKNYVDSSNIGSDNYLDTIWYTPDFISNNLKAANTNESNYFFGKNKINSRTKLGSVNNGGADFAITKVILTLDEIEKLLPSLHKIINTNEEKKWYVSLGNNQLSNPNQTLFAGGYPLDEWKVIKSTGGRIKTKDRILKISPKNSQIQFSTLKYWTRYNEELNNRFNKNNGKFDWYKTNPRSDLGHGMAIEKVIQTSSQFLYSQENNYLISGASGSMVIDSRFNPIGVIYNVISINNNQWITNQVALFNQHTNYPNWNGSIKDDVIKKLKDENKYTIKLRNL